MTVINIMLKLVNWHGASDFRESLRIEYREELQQCRISVQLIETKRHLSVRGRTVDSLSSLLLLPLFFDVLFL